MRPVGIPAHWATSGPGGPGRVSTRFQVWHNDSTRRPRVPIRERGSMAGKIRTTKINHVTTMVKDTARAMKFYNDLVGIKQIQSQVDIPEITWLQLESGIMLHLIESDEAPVKPANIHHAFEVEDFEDTKRILQENGYEVVREGVRYDGQAFLFTQDPDGNRVEFCTASGYAPAPPRH